MHIQPLRAAFDSFSGVVSGRHMAYGRYAIAARDCPNKAVIAQSLSPGTRARQAYIPSTEDATCTDMAHCNAAFCWRAARDTLAGYPRPNCKAFTSDAGLHAVHG